MTRKPREVGIVALDRKEGLEHVTIEVAAWLFRRVIAHEVDDKVVGSWRHEGGRKRSGEVIWVVGDRLLHLDSEILCVLGRRQYEDSLLTRRLGTYFVKGIPITPVIDGNLVSRQEPVDLEAVGIAVVDVCVTPSNGAVAFVLVVRVGNTLRAAKESRGQRVGGRRATNAPGAKNWVTVEDDCVCGQEASQIRAHSKSFAKSGDSVRHGQHAAMANIAMVRCGIQARAWASWIKSV